MVRFFQIWLFSALMVVSINADAQQHRSLVAHYPFSENADDASVNANDWTVTGPILVAGRGNVPNTAYEFDGIDDKILVLDDESLRLEEDYTIVVEVMTNSIKSQTILRKGGDGFLNSSSTITAAYGLSYSQTGLTIFSVNTDQQASGVTSSPFFLNSVYSTDTWYRLIARKQGSQYFLTINPIGTGSFYHFQKTIPGFTHHNTSPLVIGTRTSQVANTWDGLIDDIKIYDAYLSLEEITGFSFDDESEDEFLLGFDVAMTDDAILVTPGDDAFRIYLDRISDDYNIHLLDSSGEVIYIYNDPTVESIYIHDLPLGFVALRVEHKTDPELYYEVILKE